MRYLLDTNILSDIVRNPRGTAAARFANEFQYVCTSVICSAELRYGLAKRPSVKFAAGVIATLETIPVMSFEPDADQHYADLRAALERSGELISANDMWIAAHALALDCTLVTGNEREFRRVPGLRLENWLA